MKTNFTRLRRGSLFVFLALGSLLLYNCSSKDLEFIDPYEFVNTNFDELGDLPPVDDPEPTFTEPELGSVEISQETQSIVNEIFAAGGGGTISEETRTKLNSVQNFTNQLPATVNERARNLTPAGIQDILNPNQPLPADLVELRESMQNLPAEIRALMPKINFTADLEEVRNLTASSNKQSERPKKDRFKQTVNSDCEQAAYDAYDVRIQDLNDQREANLFIIESNYARRLDEADARYVERLALQAELYEANQDEMADATEDILASADEAESLGETEMAEQLRQLALLYAVDARTALDEWNVLALELIEIRLEQERAEILRIREEETAQVEADYSIAIAEADAVLQASLDDCHNQGSGN